MSIQNKKIQINKQIISTMEVKNTFDRLEQRLQSMINATEDNNQINHEDSIYAFERNGKALYYAAHLDRDKKKWIRKYIKKSELWYAQKLAQEEYDRRINEVAKKQLKALVKFKRIMQKNDIEEVYTGRNRILQNLITPIKLTDKQLIEEWLINTKEQQNPYPITTELYTNRGEHVRSKSEKIIADKLDSMKIPYRYEIALPINRKDMNGIPKICYPDFTLLDIKKRKVWYLEHMGMLEKDGYMADALNKLDSYIQNGIIPGKNLIITYEKEDGGLNTKNLEILLKQYLEIE